MVRNDTEPDTAEPFYKMVTVISGTVRYFCGIATSTAIENGRDVDSAAVRRTLPVRTATTPN
jgi:hypothetical protein